jgi:hypothetical protein
MLSQSRFTITVGFALIAAVTVAVAGMPRTPEHENPKWHPPIAAPIHYETTAVILADKDGVACVTFRCPADHKINASATSDLVHYQYRYQAKDGAETSGCGQLYENRITVVDGEQSGTVDVGGHLKLSAGHFQLEWSQGDASQGWLYYKPESLRLQFAPANQFDKLPLRRFAE